ncbi:sulfur oxidation c-type cytochrome SoxA [Ramlibacter terrae]|uniref:SoxAX cytochrome complex subunit A n=1 Tax=Ramlibacter terrae TaxID=2732511 RepID=A0ABX6P4V9_9BURK|nr:sulfur oxidation c-type cytochrome SoxA [Ramlibacter terrae]
MDRRPGLQPGRAPPAAGDVKRFAASWIAALLLGCAAPAAQDTRRSGFDEMGASTQAMQRDDAGSPAMLWVQEGEQLWRAAPASSRSCAGCHGEPSALRGVAARYPAWDEPLRRPVNLGTRINLCRERHGASAPGPPNTEGLLSLEALVGLQSRGQPIAPPQDDRLLPHRARGEALYRQRIGQLELSCAQCHDERAGGRLGAALIPQGHATGYPLYRLEWQALGSLGRRLRNCMTGVRAEPVAYGSEEMAQLELYPAARAMGMAVETPAVRP